MSLATKLASFTNYCSLDELIHNSDIITLHTPLNKTTEHIINDKQIQKMKKGAYIINTARGELVDIIALYNNIISGQIGGAALDVVECDKIAINETRIEANDSCSKCLTKALAVQKLLSLPNVIITPHIAYNTKESVDKLLTTTFNSIRDYLKGMHTNQLR